MDTTTAPAAAPATDPNAYIAGLIDRASDPAMPISGRNKLIDQIEAFHKGDGVVPPPTTTFVPPQNGMASEPAAGEPAEGFEPAPSPAAYGLELAMPANVSVQDVDALDALKSNLHEMGVPASLAASGFAEIALLHDNGVLSSPQALDTQFVRRNDILAKSHGADGFKAIVADGTAYLDRQVKAGKLTEAYADAIAASPMALTHAAMIARHGKR